MHSKKFWNEVEQMLDETKFSTYYFGGTLSLGLSKDRAIALNLDGTGFVMNKHTKSEKFNAKVYQPNFIHEKVMELYLKTKGYTKHFSEQRDKLQKRMAVWSAILYFYYSDK